MDPIKNVLYAPVEKELIDQIRFYFDFDPELTADPDAPERLSAEAGIPLQPGKEYPFPIQFPPKITTDQKQGIWKAPSGPDGSSAPSTFYEEPKMWAGSQSRNLNFKLTYLADGGQWSYYKIKNIAHFSKSMLYMNQLAQFSNPNPPSDALLRVPILVIEKMYGAVEEKSTWAITSVNVTHGDKIIKHTDPKTNKTMFGPLKTEIDFSCQQYTQILDDVNNLNIGNILISNLVPKPTAFWY